MPRPVLADLISISVSSDIRPECGQTAARFERRDFPKAFPDMQGLLRQKSKRVAPQTECFR
jgi:hypothetical protein